MSEKTEIEFMVKFDEIPGELKTTNSQDLIVTNAINQAKEMSKQTENCCTPVGQIKRYVDCVGCDRKHKKMSKQTAVEWLQEQLFPKRLTQEQYYCIEKAKEMEKEQMWEYIKKIYCIGHKSLEFHRLEFEQYYNETYKKEENV
jgi:hypothetical protein